MPFKSGSKEYLPGWAKMGRNYSTSFDKCKKLEI